MLARLTFECSNKHFIDWTSDDNSWFWKWLGVSADLTMLRTFFSVRTPTVCALYEWLCENVRILRRPAPTRVLFEIRDTVRKNYAISDEAIFLQTAIEIGSRADGMIQCAKSALERVLSPLETPSLGMTQHLKCLFMIAAAQRDIPMLRLLVGFVTSSDDKTKFRGDAATALLALVIRQLHDWDIEEAESDNSIADYIGLLIQGGILSPRLPAWCCCDDRPQVPIRNCESLTFDELIMMSPPTKRANLYSMILPWSNDHKIFISRAGIFDASMDGAPGLLSYLQSCKKNQGFDVHAIMQECLLFASRMNDTDTASALLGLGTDPEVGLLSKNHERYYKGVLPWNPMIVAAAAGNLEMLDLLSKRVNLASFVQRAPIYEIIQVEDAQKRYGVPTGRELRRLENLQRHCLYSRTRISDDASSHVTLPLDSTSCDDSFWTPNPRSEGPDRAFFIEDKRRIDTLRWIQDITMALGIEQSLDKEIIKAALIVGPVANTARCWHTTYHPCDVLLLEGLVDANIDYSEDGMDLLQLSIRAQCSLKIVEFLLSKGLRVHSRTATHSGNTMLHDALLSQSPDRLQIVKLLLREGADYTHSGQGLTVLEASLRDYCFCERQDSLELFTHLFELGAPVLPWSRPRLQAPKTMIHTLLELGSEDGLILRVLDAGAELNAPESCRHPESIDRRPPLQMAILQGRERLAQEFIMRGADVHTRSGPLSCGSTALQLACSMRRSLQFIQNLVELQGANVDETPRRKYDATALQHAARSGSLSVAELLLAYGSDINAFSGEFWGHRKPHRYRALDAAAERGRLDMVEFLLKAGGRSASDGLGGAIRLAKENGHFAVLSVLQDWEKEHGSRIMIEEAEWQQQNPDSARVLLETRSKNDFSGDSTSESGGSLEEDLDGDGYSGFR